MQGRARLYSIGCIPFVIVAGLACKWYRGPAHELVNNYGPASVAYELFFMLLAFAIIAREDWIKRIAGSVFFATCILEIAQLWHPPWLEALRSNTIGRMVLGTTFSWLDFPSYAIGCALGMLLLRALVRLAERKGEPSITA